MPRLFGKDKMTIKSAYIMQTVEFCDRRTYNQYIHKLYNSGKDYCVVSAVEDPETKKVLVVIKKQYNDNPMMEGGTE